MPVYVSQKPSVKKQKLTTDYWLLSFRLGGIAGLLPFHPAAFQSPNLLEARIDQLLRHPDAGALVVSGAVQDDFLVLGQGGSPSFDFVGILAHRALDFFIAAMPIFRRSDIQDNYLGVGEPAFQGLLVQARRVLADGAGSGERQHQADRQHHGP